MLRPWTSVWAATQRTIHKPAVCAWWNTQLTARGGPGCKCTSGLSSRSDKPGDGHQRDQPRSKAESREEDFKTGVPDAHAVLVSARRDCVSTPWGSALYSQPCMSRRAKTPSRNFSSSLLPTNAKQNDGLYWFWAAVSVPVGYLACVSYQSASVRMEVLTLTRCCCKSSPRELWIRKPSRL